MGMSDDGAHGPKGSDRRALPARRAHRLRRHGHRWRAVDELVGAGSRRQAAPVARGPGDEPAAGAHRLTARRGPPPRSSIRPRWPSTTWSSRTGATALDRHGVGPWRVPARGRSSAARWPAEAARIGLAVLGALGAAHAVGIVHRDVKPANVLLGPHGRVVLTDFGIAHIQGEESLTVSGEFVGSLEFIAPERMSGTHAGTRLRPVVARRAPVRRRGGLVPFPPYDAGVHPRRDPHRRTRPAGAGGRAGPADRAAAGEERRSGGRRRRRSRGSWRRWRSGTGPRPSDSGRRTGTATHAEADAERRARSGRRAPPYRSGPPPPTRRGPAGHPPAPAPRTRHRPPCRLRRRRLLGVLLGGGIMARYLLRRQGRRAAKGGWRRAPGRRTRTPATTSHRQAHWMSTQSRGRPDSPCLNVYEIDRTGQTPIATYSERTAVSAPPHRVRQGPRLPDGRGAGRRPRTGEGARSGRHGAEHPDQLPRRRRRSSTDVTEDAEEDRSTRVTSCTVDDRRRRACTQLRVRHAQGHRRGEAGHRPLQGARDRLEIGDVRPARSG